MFKNNNKQFKNMLYRILLMKYVYSHSKVIHLSHHLWPTRSVWLCLYQQRPCPLSLLLYFLLILLCLRCDAEVCKPRPITAQGRDCGQCVCLTEGGATQWHTRSHRAGRQTEHRMMPVFKPDSSNIHKHRVLQRGVGVFTWIFQRNRSETIRKSRFISPVHFFGYANGAPSLDSLSSSL